MIIMNCEGCKFKEEGYVAPILIEKSDILIVGQNPGANEIEEGYPFCRSGDCGKLLRKYTDIMEKKELKVSITNAMKCGTPNNKTPTKKETEVCKDKLNEDIRITTPKLIVVLGKVAMTAITGLTGKITTLNGHILREYSPPVLVCIHPGRVIRNKDEKEFEKGILPAIKYFDKPVDIEYKVKETIPPNIEPVGFDIETTSLKPQRGELKCFSVSDGKKAIFVEVTEDE